MSMRKILNIIVAAQALIAIGCTDSPSLPMQTLSLDKESIVAPAVGATYELALSSNTAWRISGSYPEWLVFSYEEYTGTLDLTVTVNKNSDSDSRSCTVTFVSSSDASVCIELSVEQAGSGMEGYISVAELRALEESEAEVTIDLSDKLRAFVTSSVVDNNYFDYALAVQDSFTDAGCGITVTADEALSFDAGVEVEITLSGCVLGRNDSDVLVLTLPSAEAIVQTETTELSVSGVSIYYEDLVTGDYESMYVYLNEKVQVLEEYEGCYYSDCPQMETRVHELFQLVVSEESSFGNYSMNNGGGTVCGIAGVASELPEIRPTKEDDVELTTTRLDEVFGIGSLPYIFSFYASTQTDKDTKYITVTDGTYANLGSDFIAEDNDDTGVNLTACPYGTSSSNFRLTHWADQAAHDNIPGKSFCDESNYYLLEVPLLIDLPDEFNLSFGLAGTSGCLANWIVSMSTDNSTWTEVGRIFLSGYISSSGYYYYFTLPVTNPGTYVSESTLYIKWCPTGTTIANGSTGTGLNSDARLHSCVALTVEEEGDTETPSDAIYFEAFDRLTGGMDYLWGDKLAAMMNYCGDDISSWSSTKKAGLTGENVHERPGYAQISYVESQDVARSAYTNSLGYLTTPALGASGDMTLSFKAMAYLTPSLRSGGSSTEPADKVGDLTSIVVEIEGGGTISGASSAIVTGLSTSEFNTYTLSIEDATEETQITFTSAPESGEFSRWFIDDILVTSSE